MNFYDVDKCVPDFENVTLVVMMILDFDHDSDEKLGWSLAMNVILH